MDVKWIKLAVDMFDNRKIKYIRKLPEGNNIVLIWVMLLTVAGRCNADGKIWLTENIPYTPKMLADELGFEEATVQLAIRVFSQLQMICENNGTYEIAGWSEYQNTDGMDKIREQTRKRVAECRAKKALPAQCNANVTQCNVTSNATVTHCNAIEEEEERDQDKEIHSFTHSAHTREDEKRTRLKGMGKGLVFLSDEQFSDLCEKLSTDELEYYIGVVAEAEQSGHHYKKKSHYQAILDMAAKDRRVQK